MSDTPLAVHHQLRAAVRRSSRILLGTHERPDGDAYGSLLAFRRSLIRAGLTVEAVAPAGSPRPFAYLADIDAVLHDAQPLAVDRYDLVVLFDCGDVRRTHLAEKLFYLGPHRPMTVVIDHHPATLTFRDQTLVDLPIVDRRSSSTCELVYRYLDDVREPIDPPMATALLTGIITDTGGFMNLATTLESLAVAGELLKRGAKLRSIVDATVRSKTVGMLQLWGRALSRLEHDPRSGQVTTALMLQDYEECGVDREGTEGIANFLNSLNEGRVVLVLREEPGGLVKGSYRTKQADVDVAQLARRYGGGGHMKAAGFSLAGRIVRTEHGWDVEPTPAPVPT